MPDEPTGGSSDRHRKRESEEDREFERELKGLVSELRVLVPALTAFLQRAPKIGKRLAGGLEGLTEELARNRKPVKTILEGAKVMKTIPDNTPNIRVDITPATGTVQVDAEGHKIPGSETDGSELAYKVIIDDEAGLTWQEDDAAPKDGQGNALGGELVVGGPNEDSSPRTVAVSVEAQDADGKTIGVLAGEVYVITVGAAASQQLTGAGATIAEPGTPGV